MKQKPSWPAVSDRERTAEKLAIATLVALILLPFFYYWQLPQRIPMHFGATGEPDNWGHRLTIFLLPLIALGLYVMMTLVGKRPGMMNFPTKKTPENEAALIEITRLQLRYTKMLVNLLFLYLTWGIIRIALAQATTLPMWPVWVFIGLIFLMVYYFYREAKSL